MIALCLALLRETFRHSYTPPPPPRSPLLIAFALACACNIASADCPRSSCLYFVNTTTMCPWFARPMGPPRAANVSVLERKAATAPITLLPSALQAMRKLPWLTGLQMIRVYAHAALVYIDALGCGYITVLAATPQECQSAYDRVCNTLMPVRRLRGSWTSWAKAVLPTARGGAEAG